MYGSGPSLTVGKSGYIFSGDMQCNQNTPCKRVPSTVLVLQGVATWTISFGAIKMPKKCAAARVHVRLCSRFSHRWRIPSRDQSRYGCRPSASRGTAWPLPSPPVAARSCGEWKTWHSMRPNIKKSSLDHAEPTQLGFRPVNDDNLRKHAGSRPGKQSGVYGFFMPENDCYNTAMTSKRVTAAKV